ncbi:uncharacterized protein LOC120354192 [Nilaparvata lugens]|uniref:uncharacterized protein LOC120354192 n=1 Tax=Nilaparvata lugens TaxID=108931 RepID=UPI00193D2AB4|nr:uncharacterized protein LOC120354192 [Nilaparvata lugens]
MYAICAQIINWTNLSGFIFNNNFLFQVCNNIHGALFLFELELDLASLWTKYHNIYTVDPGLCAVTAAARPGFQGGTGSSRIYSIQDRCMQGMGGDDMVCGDEVVGGVDASGIAATLVTGSE